MKITLADIAVSERICAAATGGPWVWEWVPDGPYNELKLAHLHIICDADETLGATQDREFITHARTQLPAMNALVREMLDQIRWLVHSINTYTKESGNIDIFIEQAKARRLIERMEENM